MAESLVPVRPDSTGKKLRHRERTVGANTVYEQYVIVENERLISYTGRSVSFRIPGRALTTGQTLMQLFNGAGSGVLVACERISFDQYQTVVKGVLIHPPLIRIRRVSAALTGGVAMSKVAQDTNQSSAALVTLLQDASADGTSAATALGGVAVPDNTGTMTQEVCPRLITAAGYEVADRLDFLDGDEDRCLLREGQGVTVRLDTPVTTTQSPTTDMHVVTVRWSEFTLP